MVIIQCLDQVSNVYVGFESFMNSKKKEELDKIIAEENLNKEEMYNFIQRSIEHERVKTTGAEVPKILSPMDILLFNESQKN